MDGPSRVLAPYTHLSHAKRCQIAGREGLVLRQFVQARVGRAICCARILEAWDAPEGGEMWRLDLLSPTSGIRSAPARLVRQCSGIDGRCVCAGELGQDGLPAGPSSPAQEVTC